MKKSDLKDRLRGIYRVPIIDGLGPAGGEEPDNPDEFVRMSSELDLQHFQELADEHRRELETKIERLENLLSKATRFSFGNGADRRPEVYVESRGSGKWAVTDGFNSCYSESGAVKWEPEPMPSSRTDEFIARTRYSLDEAVAIAERLVQQEG